MKPTIQLIPKISFLEWMKCELISVTDLYKVWIIQCRMDMCNVDDDLISMSSDASSTEEDKDASTLDTPEDDVEVDTLFSDIEVLTF